MGFNIHILSGRNRSTNLAGHAALAASFNPNLDSIQKQPALGAFFARRLGSSQDCLSLDKPRGQDAVLIR